MTILSLVIFSETMKCTRSSLIGVVSQRCGSWQGFAGVTTPHRRFCWSCWRRSSGLSVLCLKSGAIELHRDWRTLVYNWRLAAGVGAFLLSSVFFVMGVRHGEFTILYPMGSLGYIWTLLWSRIFFGEPLTRSKFFGLGMILARSRLSRPREPVVRRFRLRARVFWRTRVEPLCDHLRFRLLEFRRT